MFIALYSFTVKPGHEKEFEENWHQVTKSIRAVRGSLGSRLHRADDGTYVAYAQWPSEAQYHAEIPLPDDAMAARARMKAACSEMSVLKLMSVVDDLLDRR